MKDQMKKSLVQKLSYWSGVIVIGVLVGLSLQLARAAWSEPTAPAPGGNVEAPLNISAIDQTKSGSLQLNGLALQKSDKALIIPNGNVGVGTVNPNPSKGLAGYLSAKDVYLNDIGKWASSLSGGGGGTLTGGGSTNYIPKWTGGTTLGNSIMRDQGADGVFIFNASGGAVTAISTSTMAAVYGLNGNTGNGVTGWSVGEGGNGVYGNGYIGIYGQGTKWAGYFQGKVKISGMGNGLSFPDGTLQTTAATAAPPPPPPISAAKFYTQQGALNVLTVSCNAGDVMTGGSCYGQDQCSGEDSSGYGGYPSGSNSWTCPPISCNRTTAYVRCYDL